MNQLPLARTAYTRAAQLDTTQSLALQQRGHVESFLGNYDAARADYDAAIKLAKNNEAPSYGMFRAFVAAYAGDSKRSLVELDALVSRIDSMDIPDKVGAKVNALTSEAQIAIQVGDFTTAARAISQRTPLVREQVAQATDPRTKDFAEADIDYYDGFLAARSGDATTAKAKADDIMRIVAETSDPRKNQNAHAVLGVLALEQKDFAGASAHFTQANQDDMFVTYEHALALEGMGKTKEAKAMFRKVARYNFNGPDVAVARADAMKRSM
jgi:tetratricopeptide (TPR) repeat protein